MEVKNKKGIDLVNAIGSAAETLENSVMKPKMDNESVKELRIKMYS